MYRARRWLLNGIGRLEVHEILSLFMLAFLTALYGFGLEDESFAGEVLRIGKSAGPITMTISLLAVVFFIALFFLPKGGTVAGHAKVLGRVMLSFLVMLIAFEAVTHYIDAKQLPLQDEALQRIDAGLFAGKQPSERMEWLNASLVNYLSSFVYLSWFGFTYATIFLMWRKGRQALMEYSASALLTFYAGYILYIVVPAYGPVFTYDYSTSVDEGLTAMMMDDKLFSPVADAFPSLHTALSVVMFSIVRKYGGRWMWLYAPFMIGIIASTVHLRIHYAIDVIAGIVLAIAMGWICRSLVSRREIARQPDKGAVAG